MEDNFQGGNQYLRLLRESRIRNYVHTTYTGEKLVEEIRLERRRELCFEGHRWFDLVRSGKAVEVMNQHFTNFYNAYTSNSSPNVNNYYMKSEKFEIDQYCTLFPIPSQEIRSNPKLTQNYGAR